MKYKTIIDGVNVSECKHYTGNVDYLSNKDWTCRAEMINTRCEDCPNCYFKQHKRAEQECEELKTIINKSAEKFANDYLETFEENQKLKDDLQNIQHNCTREGCRYYEDNTYKVFYKCKAKTEADKMEQKIKQVKSFVAGLMFDVDCINWFERFVVAFEDWKTQLGNDRDRYKQALDEIETLLQDALDTEKTDTQESFDNFYKCLDIIAKAKEQ